MVYGMICKLRKVLNMLICKMRIILKTKAQNVTRIATISDGHSRNVKSEIIDAFYTNKLKKRFRLPRPKEKKNVHFFDKQKNNPTLS
jgi:hypothetical protein